MAERAPTLLELASITKRYPGVLALDRAEMSVRAGEVGALVGKNGAGKSTLMGVLSGLVTPDEGHVRFAGTDLAGASMAEMEAKGIALVPQHSNLFAELSLVENLLVPRQLPRRGGLVDWPAARRRARAALELVGSDLPVDSLVRPLNAAARRSVMIARALVREPQVLILDEPTESFTEQEVERLFSLLRRLVSDGMAVVYVSHRLEEVLEISDSITVMRDGRTVDRVAPHATSHEGLVELIVGGSSPPAAQARSVEAVPGEARPPVLRVSSLHCTGAKDISLHVDQGEIVGLYGPLGSGRAHVLQALAGLTPIDDGHVEIGARREASGGTVYVPEDRKHYALFPELTIRENVTIGDVNGSRRSKWSPLLSKRRDRDRAASVLRHVRFDRDDLDQPAGALSGGTQQKVVLARGLLRDPLLWLLDEPLMGLDIATRRDVFRILRERCSQRGGALVVLSDYEDLAQMCDRVYAMREGRLCGEFHRHSMTEADLLHAVSFAPPIAA